MSPPGEVRATLRALIGTQLERPVPKVLSRHIREDDGFVIENLILDLGSTGPVAGVLTRPAGSGPHPAVLYAHAHGGNYAVGCRELLDGRPALQGPYGPALARAGFVALCLDMPCFGARQTPGEQELAKKLLWRGETLFGLMLADLAAGFEFLSRFDSVDPARIAVVGLSMGATQAFWLAALEPRIAACLHLCCYCDLATLVEEGEHQRHGIYMMVPGLIRQVSTGTIAGLVAPRPQLILVGDADPLTPPLAIARAYAETRAAYAAPGAEHRLGLHIEAGSGHVETKRMRALAMSFLADLA